MSTALVVVLSLLFQQSANFNVDAAHGTGLEWMTVGSVVLPALLLILLVYLGRGQTV